MSLSKSVTTRIMSVFVLSLLLTTTAPVTVQASAYPRDEWERLLPGCTTATNVWDAAVCIFQNSPSVCFDSSTPQELYQCFTQDGGSLLRNKNHSNIMRDVLDTALDCLDPYHQCLVDQVSDAIENLPPCVPQSATDMAQCFIDNVVDCFASCAGTVWESPLADLNIFDLFSCNGIERNLLAPVCDIVACCPPCLDPLESVAECIVNDVLDFGWWGECDFECEEPTNDRRRRARESTGTVVATTESSSTKSSQEQASQKIVQGCLALTPGLMGDTSQASASLVARSNFFDCLVQESLGVFAHVEETTTTSTVAAPPASDAATTEAGSDVENELNQSTDTTDVDTSPLTASKKQGSAAIRVHGMYGWLFAVVILVLWR